MSFTASELNRVRKNWEREQEHSDPTDPDYTEKAEQRFIKDLLTLSPKEQKLALAGYSNIERKRLMEKMEKMKS